MMTQRKDNITAKNVVYVGGCGYPVISNVHGHNHRIGGRDNFFHCDTCGLCLQLSIRETHKCVVEASRSNCPVCMEVTREGIAKRCQVCFNYLGLAQFKECSTCAKMWSFITSVSIIDFDLMTSFFL